MIRNEQDIILPVLNQAATLFDRYMIVDVQSTDGTLETIRAFSQVWPNIELYTCSMQERYQSVMMNALAAKAFNDGADWIFFLDGDEFVNVDSQAALQSYLREFPHEVMHLPWINLVPAKYGLFESFDVTQQFYWSGRVSPFNKIAVSSIYIAKNPAFYIHEGNHNISPAAGADPGPLNLGLTLLHIPIRSADRLKYRLSNGLRLLGSKHNRLEGEGNHAGKILDLIARGRVGADQLNAIAATYGVNEDRTRSLDPRELQWPSKFLPAYIGTSEPVAAISRGLSETALRDSRLVWEKSKFVKASPVKAHIEGSNVRILCQPMIGDGLPFRGKYERLPAINPDIPAELNPRLLIDSVAVSFLKPRVLTFSAWSKLIPVLFCIFAITRPRRFVELGVHNGMSFFAACQAAEHLNLRTQCVAVDSWVGDPHASFHSNDVLDQFRLTIGQQFPQQHYIQAYFSDALQCFEDESIDLLHIDGYHVYEAVKEDFETWLPKMSQTGVVLFHDINVHEKGFGVWRLWDELKARCPAFSFYHCHGLGILYVGSHSNSILELLALLKNNNDYETLAQQYFEALGELAIEHRTLAEEAGSHATREAELASLRNDLALRDAELASLRDMLGQASARADSLLGLWRDIFGRFSSSKQYKKGQYKEDYRIITSSGLFDADYYLATYGDVRAAWTDPVSHFVLHGASELRKPNAHFNTAGYLSNNHDVLIARVNPFVHYLLYGLKEGRKW